MSTSFILQKIRMSRRKYRDDPAKVPISPKILQRIFGENSALIKSYQLFDREKEAFWKSKKPKMAVSERFWQ